MLGATKDLHHLCTKGAGHLLWEIQLLVQELNPVISLMFTITLSRLGTHTCSRCTAELQLKHRNKPCLSPHIVHLALTSATAQHASPGDISVLLTGQEHSIPVNRFNYSFPEIQWPTSLKIPPGTQLSIFSPVLVTYWELSDFKMLSSAPANLPERSDGNWMGPEVDFGS